MVTLRQLQIFLAVARRQHVTAAARDVHLSQSAVSTALRELASGLGGPLFVPRGRRIELNERGHRLLDDAADLLQRVDDLVHRYRRSDAIAGRLRLGASTTIGMYLLPELLAGFVQLHPDVDVDLQVGNSEEIEARVLARELDAGFIEGPKTAAAIEARPWRDDELCVFVAAGHALAGRRCRPSRLSPQRWVVRERGSGTRAVLAAALREHGLEAADTVTFGHSEAVKQGVRCGLGLGCLSTLALRRELATGEFVRVKVQGLDLRRRLWHIERRGAFRSAALTACLEALGCARGSAAC